MSDDDNSCCIIDFNTDPNDKFILEERQEKPGLQSPPYERSLSKSGLCLLRKRRGVHRYSYFAKDAFTSLVDLRWRYILAIYSFSFLTTWFLFGILWWVVAYGHGDLISSPNKDPNVEPCVSLIDDMTSAFLFSLETQYTTGYGTRSPTTECPEAIFLLCVQSIFGVLFQSVLVGVIFSKLSRAKARSQAIRFSKKCVICLRDGNLCLMFRLADVWKSHLVDCKIHAWLLQNKVSAEGEILHNYKTKLTLSVDDGGRDFFLLWPVTVVHKIDRNSPLYEMSPLDLFASKFEIIVSLVCTAEATGQTAEARCSYAPNEILWGHRFQNTLIKDEYGLHVDYQKFDKTTRVDTALCSASELYSWSHGPAPISLKTLKLMQQMRSNNQINIEDI